MHDVYSEDAAIKKPVQIVQVFFVVWGGDMSNFFGDDLERFEEIFKQKIPV